MPDIDVTQHILVPEHSKLTQAEADALLSKHNISLHQLPKILKSDAAIKHLNAEVGEVIKIVRPSVTAGTTEFFRMVING